MLPLKGIQYEVQHCTTHKNTIYFFPSNRIGKETQCWTCVKEANDRKFKIEQERQRTKEQFSQEFAHLWAPQTSGGIEFVSLEKDGLHVHIQSSEEACRRIPDIYLEYQVHKEIVGESE